MASILIADDDRAIRKIVRDRLAAAGHSVETAADGREALLLVQRHEPDLVLLDLAMPEVDGFGVLDEVMRLPAPPMVVVITAHGTIEAAVRAMKAGAHDFLQKPFDAAQLELLVSRSLETRTLRRDVVRLRDELGTRHRLVLGERGPMHEVVERARKAASSSATVLLTGESGTGKEVVARAIHAESPRASGPFVAVNCATLSPELLESELFGHEKGAFTGAVKAKPGRFELAAGGTLFLDEIGELAPAVQAKLLRVLQEREFERVGGTRTLTSDARLVAATNRDLAAAVSAGTFRQDLFYRLNVVSLRLPPLRERREDVAPIAAHFLARFADEAGRPVPRLSEDALAALRSYSWPGNVRELANCIERCLVFSSGEELTAADLPEEIHEAAPLVPAQQPAPGVPGGPRYHDAVTAAKRAILIAALEAEDGHQTRAAKRLGLTQPYLARLLKNLEIR